jgi:hypothetical protein
MAGRWGWGQVPLWRAMAAYADAHVGRHDRVGAGEVAGAARAPGGGAMSEAEAADILSQHFASAGHR